MHYTRKTLATFIGSQFLCVAVLYGMFNDQPEHRDRTTVRDAAGRLVGSFEGYLDGRVFNASGQQIGRVDPDGTYDRANRKILDKPLPGWLLARESEKD